MIRTMQKITSFYGSITMLNKQSNFTPLFSKTQIIDTVYHAKSAAEASVRFKLRGQLFMALTGGPVFKLSPAM
jgi:hypothetical protein